MDWTLGSADTWASMANWLSALATTLPRQPAAILVISAHWETPRPTLTASTSPPLIYDYYGFPAHTYELDYPAPGAPDLAARCFELLEKKGIAPGLDPDRGFDHGVFIPLKLIFPDANLPIVQLSLLQGLDPGLHIAMGQALAPLREQNVLIVGSGLSSHNLTSMMQPDTELEGSADFNNWLIDVTAAEPLYCREQLISWRQAPYARQVHPREEHLIPLMVAAGAAGNDPGRCVFQDQVMGATAVGIQFG